jgi:hypothetical protein
MLFGPGKDDMEGGFFTTALMILLYFIAEHFFLGRIWRRRVLYIKFLFPILLPTGIFSVVPSCHFL